MLDWVFRWWASYGVTCVNSLDSVHTGSRLSIGLFGKHSFVSKNKLTCICIHSVGITTLGNVSQAQFRMAEICKYNTREKRIVTEKEQIIWHVLQCYSINVIITSSQQSQLHHVSVLLLITRSSCS